MKAQFREFIIGAALVDMYTFSLLPAEDPHSPWCDTLAEKKMANLGECLLST